MARSKNAPLDPVTRLGRWDGSGFVPVSRRSIAEQRVHVMVHGWGRGLAPTLDETGGFLLVWDDRAETPEGGRFDRWFGPLAEAILADDPEAAVLAFSWVDESATAQGALNSIRSQLRTTVNGQRLAVALDAALSDADHHVHLIGYSHGAKVVAIGATLLDPPPRHVTILDSPENTLPILGGALNDLTSYLRVLAPGNIEDDIFVDNYASHFGIRYGIEDGLGSVVDTVLDPEQVPMDSAPSEHAYAWAWYLDSARRVDRGVGFAWSPLRTKPAKPAATQLRQVDQDGDAFLGPLALEENPDRPPATVGAKVRTRARDEFDRPRVLSVPGKSSSLGFFWRRSGDLLASAVIDWESGPDDALVRVFANRTERARTVRGWTESPRQHVTIPLGSARSGPMFVHISLESNEPAEVSVGRATAIQGLMLPSGAEYRAWIRPIALVTFIGATAAIGGLLATALSRRGR